MSEKYHGDVGHAGPDITLGATRKKYWITAGMNTVKHYLKDCVICIKKHSRADPQFMGEHPAARTATWQPAFTHTGIDYFGPFKTSIGLRGRTKKNWGVIFTCLTSRAVHLDIVDSLSMDACINAIERFLGQYADVTIAFHSDNGTNFEGVNNALTRMYDRNTHQQIQRYFRPRRISWHFNTPSASSQGGAWERLICSVRRLLSNLPVDPQNVPISPDKLRTMLAGAQKILNARPLTPIRANPQDCDAITPSSLIHHHSINPVNPIGTLPARESLLVNYRQVQDRVDVFWQKWMLLYTQYLQKRHAQRMNKKNLKVGDLVLMIDKPTPRGQYPLARVIQVFPDNLNCVRRVRIMTANANKLNPNLPCSRNVYDRDTTKLALLEFPAVNPESENIEMTTDSDFALHENHNEVDTIEILGNEELSNHNDHLVGENRTPEYTNTVNAIQQSGQVECEGEGPEEAMTLSPEAHPFIPAQKEAHTDENYWRKYDNNWQNFNNVLETLSYAFRLRLIKLGTEALKEGPQTGKYAESVDHNLDAMCPIL